MPAHTKRLWPLYFFWGSASAILADTDNRTDYRGSVVHRAISVTTFNVYDGALNHAVKPIKAEEAAPQLALVQSAPFCGRGITDTTMTWIKLTEPDGKLININVGQVTSVRSNTQIPGAKAQFNLVSGKLQGVQARSCRRLTQPCVTKNSRCTLWRASWRNCSRRRRVTRSAFHPDA
jgi:hypothetical protein